MAILEEEPAILNDDEMEDDEMENVSDEASESESEEYEDVKLAQPSKNSIYNRDAILDKLEDIAWPEDVGWMHKLSIDIDREQEADVNDDLARELAFYTHALEGSREGYRKVQSMGLPFLRPPDYYAEMVKSDTHMEKVKGRLLAEKKNIEEADERRKAREAKRISKEVQAQKLKERAKQKKMEIESVKKWRKQRQRSGFAGGDKNGDMDFPFEDGKSFGGSKKRPGVGPGDRSGGKERQGGKGKKGMHKKANKREARDSKYGFGGRKALKKQNDAEDDFKGFNKGFENKKRKR